MVNLGDLTQPATVLVDRISDAVGGAFKPWQIRRVARAEADAAITRATADLHITDLQQRALGRFFAEETRKQENIESIGALALPNVGSEARAEDIEEDWLFNFLDKSKLISDSEMQALWARILAGEANAPGTFSRRTVNALGSFDKSDAELFTQLRRFSVSFGGSGLTPVVTSLGPRDDVFKPYGLQFDTIRHLADIGLVTATYGWDESYGFIVEKETPVEYYGEELLLVAPMDENNRLKVGHLLYSQMGSELATIVDADPVPGFVDHLCAYWQQQKIGVACRFDPKSRGTI